MLNPDLRVTIAAPFPSHQAFGGSQRVTSVRERLEDRGIAVEWVTFAPDHLAPWSRLARVVRGRPRLRFLSPSDLTGPADVVVVAHSYLAESVLARTGAVPTVVDFVDLEHRAWTDMAATMPWSLRRATWTLEARAMSRYERRLLNQIDAAMFTCDEEVQWAGAASSPIPLVTVPNVLPRQFEAEARAICQAPAIQRKRGDAVAGYYMGTLEHSPNSDALVHFLERHWPVIRTIWPDLRLIVAGRAPTELIQRLRQFPGVEAHGYVEDPLGLIKQASFALMPFGNRAGTSLRVLYYALAGVPLIGSPLAFRGLSSELGTAASSSEQWVDGITAALSVDRAAVLRQLALATAHSIQSDPAPWDSLASLLRDVASGPSAHVHDGRTSLAGT